MSSALSVSSARKLRCTQPRVPGMNSLMTFMSNLYLYMKAAHLIAAFAWVAGLFYLPRLFAYHAQIGVGTPQAETFKAMERRLLNGVMNPAMVVTIGFGVWMIAYLN